MMSKRRFHFENLEVRTLLTCDFPIGDFDSSGVYDTADIDFLSNAVRARDHGSDFDLDENVVVNRDDRLYWLQECAKTSYGDSDLNGEFHPDDYLNGWNGDVYENGLPASWADGDFDGDADFDRFDVIEALQTGLLENESQLATASPTNPTLWPLSDGGAEHDGRVSLEYVRETGELRIHTDDIHLTAISIESANGNLDSIGTNKFDVATPNVKFVENHGQEIFVNGIVMPPDLTKEQVLSDISVIGAICTGPEVVEGEVVDSCVGAPLGEVDLIYRDSAVIDVSDDAYHEGQLENQSENWFRWKAEKRGRLNIGLIVDNDNVVVDLIRGGELLQRTITTSQMKQLSWEVIPGETYFIRATRFDSGGTAPTYELTVSQQPDGPRAYVLTQNGIRSYDTITLEEYPQEFIEVPLSHPSESVYDIEIGPTGLLYVMRSFGGRSPSLLEITPGHPDVPAREISVPNFGRQGEPGFDVLSDGTFMIVSPWGEVVRFDRDGQQLTAFETQQSGMKDATVTRSGEIVWTSLPANGFRSLLSPTFDGGTWHYEYTTPDPGCRRFCPEISSRLLKTGTVNHNRTINLELPANFVLDVQETADGSLFYVTQDDLFRLGAPGTLSGDASAGGAVALAISNGEFDVRIAPELSLDDEPTLLPDRDHDGLADIWEEMGGIDVDGDNVVDVPLPGADPDHKDIYVEVDVLTGFGPAASEHCANGCSFTPTNTVLDRVMQSFADVPRELVYNPDETGGINLHIIIDSDQPIPSQITLSDETTIDLNRFPEDPTEAWPLFYEVKSQFAGTPVERASGKAEAIFEARQISYRYAIFGNERGSRTFGELADEPGRNMLLTLGNWGPDGGGTPDQQAAMFMHALGHTLGLQHGGGDGINYKPNHLSVMNFSHLHGETVNGDKLLDYSRYSSDFPGYKFGNSAIDELAVVETAGAGFPSNVSFSIPVDYNSSFEVSGSSGIDWDQDGNVEAVQDLADLNGQRFGELVRSDREWGDKLKISLAQIPNVFNALIEEIPSSPSGIPADNCPRQRTPFLGSGDKRECNDSIDTSSLISDSVLAEDLDIGVDTGVLGMGTPVLDTGWFEFDFDVAGIVEVVVEVIVGSASDLLVNFYGEDRITDNQSMPLTVSSASTDQKHKFVFDYDPSTKNSTEFMHIGPNDPGTFVPTGYRLSVEEPRAPEEFEWTGSQCSASGDCRWHHPNNWKTKFGTSDISPEVGADIVFPPTSEQVAIDLYGLRTIVGDMIFDGDYRFYNSRDESVSTIIVQGDGIHVSAGQLVEFGVPIENGNELTQSGDGLVVVNAPAGTWHVSGNGVLAGSGPFKDVTVGQNATLSPGPVSFGQHLTGEMTINDTLDISGTIQLDVVTKSSMDVIRVFDAFLEGARIEFRHKAIGYGGETEQFLFADFVDGEFVGLNGHQGGGFYVEGIRRPVNTDFFELEYYQHVPGDSNLDREFNSADFVTVFQAAKYENNIVGDSTWEEGDWNGDGDFDSSDLVLAFQGAFYEQGPLLAAPVVFIRRHDGDERNRRIIRPKIRLAEHGDAAAAILETEDGRRLF
ncbi:MAG: hypothetical protein KDA87_12020 [Planctomycetales bacterium]|nr:hypothetical protein [Planctomycetales bacterium]